MGPSSEDPSDVRSGDASSDRAPDARESEAAQETAGASSPPQGEVSGSEVAVGRTGGAAESGSYESGVRQRRDPESEMATMMSTDTTPDPALERITATGQAQAQVRRRAVGSDDELFDAVPARTIVRIRRPIEDAPAREQPTPRRVVAPPLPPSLRRDRSKTEGRRVPSLGWAVVAGVAIAGVIVFVQRVILPGPAPAPTSAAKTTREPAVVDKKAEPTNARTEAIPTTQEPTTVPERPASDRPPVDLDDRPPVPAEEPRARDVAPAPTPSKPVPSVDPRKPPQGTPPEIAATFAKLPVSPADLPPVGGVGRSGIHIDRIEMGSVADKSGCSGLEDRFSLDKLERINVCLRVVHPREEESVSIVWQKKKDAGTARRGKIAIKPQHAYRTRAYLVLRKEYVGDWTVRILSADGVELASHGFTIVP